MRAGAARPGPRLHSWLCGPLGALRTTRSRRPCQGRSRFTMPAMAPRRLLTFLTTWLCLGLLGPSGQGAAKPRLAVLEFRPAGATKELESLGSGLQSMLTTDLSQAEGVTMVERARLHDVQGELKLGKTRAVDPATAAKAGKLAGASHIVVGTFTVVGKKLRLDTRLVEVASGKVALATSVDGEQDAFFELEKTLVNRLLAGIGVTLSARERGAVARIHTTDFEAFRRFSAGVSAFDEARYEEALAQLRAAAQKDEDFKLARV